MALRLPPPWMIVLTGLVLNILAIVVSSLVLDKMVVEQAQYRERQQGNVYSIQLAWNTIETLERKRESMLLHMDISTSSNSSVTPELEEAMREYGYGIVKALVTDIDPDHAVKQAMNRINASEREKVAAEYEAEAERIRIVARAKAEAESKRLQGQGIADQRREIARGLEESVEVLNKVGINSQEASALIVVTQHYDTLQSMGENSNSNLVLLPNSPAAGSNMLSEMVTSFTASQMLGEKMKEENKVKK